MAASVAQELARAIADEQLAFDMEVIDHYVRSGTRPDTPAARNNG
jgi:hypothetical protein